MPESRVTNTDYFPLLAVIADENNEISADIVNNGKPLDELLAKKFKLSRPTVRALLSDWEREGRIEVGKDALRGSIRKIRILNIFHRQKEKEKPPKILVLIDWENLHKSIEAPEKLTLVEDFDKTLKEISREAGQIVNVFVFCPPHSAMIFGADFDKLGFFTIFCPKTKTKTGEEKDITDDVLMEFGRRQIEQIPNLTHICLGSGDKDFSPLVRMAIRQGLKIIVIAGSHRTLSTDLIKLSDKRPDNSKMVYIFPSAIK